MAMVRHLEYVPLQSNVRHTEVEATYSIVRDDDGHTFIQIDTYGSRGREIPGKKSQSLRFSPEAVAELKVLLSQYFP